MSAVSFVGLIYITLMMISIGLSNASQIFIARRRKDRNTEVGAILSNAMFIGLAIAVVQFFVLRFGLTYALPWLASSSDVQLKMLEFSDVRSYGFFFLYPDNRT